MFCTTIESSLLADQPNDGLNASEIYEIKLSKSSVTAENPIPSSFILTKIRRNLSPDIRILGQIVLKDDSYKNKIYARLQKKTLTAHNQYNQSIDIDIQGNLKNSKLDLDYIPVVFDEEKEEALFMIEGYIDPMSFDNKLAPGNYNYIEDFELDIEIRNQ